MTKKLKWRLGKLPTPDEVVGLVKDKVITKEEAREILFSREEDMERSIESYRDEIKFLRTIFDTLTSKLSSNITVKVPYTPTYGSGTVWWNNYSDNVALCSSNGTDTTFQLSSNTNFTSLD